MSHNSIRAQICDTTNYSEPNKNWTETTKQNTKHHNPAQSLMEERRTKGLCYKYGDKFYPGHKCSKQALYALIVEGGEEEEEWGSEMVELSTGQKKEATIANCEPRDDLDSTTLRVYGNIGQNSP